MLPMMSPECFGLILLEVSFGWLLLFTFSYLCGSIPFGPIFARIFKLGNMQEQGSGNIGATNMARIGGKKLGIAVALCDGIKGVIPVAIGHWLGFSYMILAVIALTTVIGHIFPVWLKFKGGKGIATSIGALTALSWKLGFMYIGTWLLVFVITRISSFASILGVIIAVIGGIIFLPIEAASLVGIMSTILIYKHQDNIMRLWQGTEKRS